MEDSMFDKALEALAVKRDKYEVQRKDYDGQPQSEAALRHAQQHYFAAMEGAIVASPHEVVVRNYATAATTAVHLLCMLNHEVAHTGPSVANNDRLERVRSALQRWAEAERHYVALGYRSVTLEELKRSTRLPGAGEKPPELYYDKVFVRRNAGETAILWGQAEVESFAVQAKDLIARRETIVREFNIPILG